MSSDSLLIDGRLIYRLVTDNPAREDECRSMWFRAVEKRGNPEVGGREITPMLTPAIAMRYIEKSTHAPTSYWVELLGRSAILFHFTQGVSILNFTKMTK